MSVQVVDAEFDGTRGEQSICGMGIRSRTCASSGGTSESQTVRPTALASRDSEDALFARVELSLVQQTAGGSQVVLGKAFGHPTNPSLPVGFSGR